MGRLLAVADQHGIQWLAVAVRRGAGRDGQGCVSRSFVRLRSVPNGNVSEMKWVDLKALLMKGAVVIL